MSGTTRWQEGTLDPTTSPPFIDLPHTVKEVSRFMQSNATTALQLGSRRSLWTIWASDPLHVHGQTDKWQYYTVMEERRVQWRVWTVWIGKLRMKTCRKTERGRTITILFLLHHFQPFRGPSSLKGGKGEVCSQRLCSYPRYIPRWKWNVLISIYNRQSRKHTFLSFT